MKLAQKKKHRGQQQIKIQLQKVKTDWDEAVYFLGLKRSEEIADAMRELEEVLHSPVGDLLRHLHVADEDNALQNSDGEIAIPDDTLAPKEVEQKI